MKIAAVIQNLFTVKYKGFCNHCIKKFIYRFEEFNNPTYQLAFFLHSAYKQGSRIKIWCIFIIANYAGELWQKMEIDKLEGLAKVYQFNLLTAAEKFHKTQTEISFETMKNVAETVFNEFEEEAFLEESENAELSTEIQLNIFIQMNRT
ncbi:unnamed protein product [Rhizophagus irregularis]|nr:unnamed protein product [Rhizophagus irregularis]